MSIELSEIPLEVSVDEEGQPDNIDPDYEVEEADSIVTSQPDVPEPDDPDSIVIDKFAQPGRVRRLATILNLLNTLLGAGILGVPNSMISCGVVPSCIMITLVAVLTHISTMLTIKIQRRMDADGYDDIASKVLGRWGSIALSIMSMVYCYSCMVSYLIITFGTISSWFSLGGINIDTTLWRAITVFISGMIGPVALTLPRHITWMKWGSYASFGGIIFFGVSMIIKGATTLPYPADLKPNISIAKADLGLFSAIAVYSLAFALPVVVLPIVEPYNKDLHRRAVVCGTAVFLCWLSVIVPGIMGYLLYGDKTATIVLENFPNDDPLMIAVRIGFVFVTTFSYPAIGQSVLASWSSIFYKTNLQGELPTKRRIWVIVMTNIIPMVLAMFLPDAKPALNIGGAFGGCLADFFFPSLIWVIISKKDWFHWQNLLNIVMCIFGVVVAGISTYQAIVDAIDAFTK